MDEEGVTHLILLGALMARFDIRYRALGRDTKSASAHAYGLRIEVILYDMDKQAE